MFETVNYIEAGSWVVIGVCFIAHAARRRGRSHLSVLAALVFILFGVSDLVEVETGAWWRPWWLLLWKSVCVVSLAVLYSLHRQRGTVDHGTGDRGGVSDRAGES